MQLSADQFLKIVETLHSDEGNCRGHEKRKEGRVGVSCIVDVTPRLFDDQGQKTLRVKVRGLSKSGIGFITHIQIDVGTELVCRLPCDKESPVDLLMTVRHCQRLPHHMYNVGASFVVLPRKSKTPKPGVSEKIETNGTAKRLAGSTSGN